MKHSKVVLGLAAFLLGIATLSRLLPTVSAQRPPRPAAPRTSQAGTVVVPRCRVEMLKRVNLAFDRVGTLKKIDLRDGDPVKKRQLLAGLNDDVARAALDSAETKASNDVHTRYALASYKVAQLDVQLALESNRKGGAGTVVVPPLEVEKLRLAATRSKLQIEQAESDQVIAGLDRDLARAQLNTYYIHAPFDGIITRRFRREGEAVQQGETVLSLVSVETMKVSGKVPIGQVLELTRGQKVTVRLANPDDGRTQLPQRFLDAVFEGTLVYIDPGANPVDGLDVRVWAEVTNIRGLLRSGLTATMHIHPVPPARSAGSGNRQ